MRICFNFITVSHLICFQYILFENMDKIVRFEVSRCIKGALYKGEIPEKFPYIPSELKARVQQS